MMPGDATQQSSRVTIHMVASLDGYVARTGGSVDWLDSPDEYADGATMDAGVVVWRQADLRSHQPEVAADPGHGRVLLR
jgi:hypothetical protein